MCMNLQMLKKWPDATMLGVFILVGLVLFTLTNPQHVAPAVLVVGFFVLFGIFYSALRLVGRKKGLKERLRPLQYNGLMIGAAALPVMLLALQSIGQLTIRDTITLIVIFVAGYFYVSRQQG
jgi:phosphatidylglycerophosphate synthase